MSAQPSPAPSNDSIAASLEAEPGFPLLADGLLRLTADHATSAQVRYWLPRLPPAAAPAPGGAAPTTHRTAEIAVVLRDLMPYPPAARPTLRIGPVEGWIYPSGDLVTLLSRDRSVAGEIDLSHLKTTIGVSPQAARPIASEAEPRNAAVFSALTLASALLLNRMRRALLHAAAVVAPDGGAWLLVGDAFAGKTTTTVNLIRSGWDWISDDHLILSRAPDGALFAEGWPRAFHLDRGYETGLSTGERDAVDPATFGPGRWRRGAPLAGVLFPRVVEEQPTATAATTAGDALPRLIRQSPWLLADPAVARDVLSLLTDAIARDTYHLRLGHDSYQDPARLVDALAAIAPALSPHNLEEQ